MPIKITLPYRVSLIMLLGIGTDIIEVSRIKANINKYGARFLDRIFTIQEQTYCFQHRVEPERHFAGRFAAKEAVVKAIGTGFRTGISWLDIEIINSSDGKPEIFVSSRLKERFNNPNILISISHCREFATAFAIWQDN